MQNGIDFETWYEDFNRFAGDLYPGRYTRDVVKDLVEAGRQVQQAAGQKNSLIVAHNYQYPELQEVAQEVGDSLGLMLATLTKIIVEALLVTPDDVTRETRLFSDLGAESIDILDIRFRVEHAFGFKIDQDAMMLSLGEGLSSSERDDRFTIGFLLDYIKSQLPGAEQ